MAEDWYWTYFKFPPNDTWELNRDEYPNYERLIADQHSQGVKHLSYFTPGFCPTLWLQKSKVFEAGKAAGVFTKDAKGNPALFDFFVWRNSQIDATNPEARKWFANKFYEMARNWGVDGWMNDFGEYTPYDSRSSNGELGWSMHNRYPLLWAQLAREFWDEKRPDGDSCVFARSGYFGQLSNLSFLFTADRDATYEPLSGLGGQVTGILNASLSAHPNTSMDIGAYNAISAGPMGKLLMFRWIEMGALVPVMRLHRGFPAHDHWRFDSDAETLAHWKKYAILHTQLFPYIYTLAHQAQEEGLPMVRHLVLHYPQDKQAAKQDFEFLLGDRILSAPIISEQIPRSRADMSVAKQTAKIYLPTGNWYHFWSNRPYRGGDYVEVPAAPGFLPMFVKEGTILPLFDSLVDTLVEGVEDPAIRDFEVANRSVEIRFYGFGHDLLTLWDGTTLQCSRERGQAGRYQVSDGKGRGYKAVFVD